MSMKRLLIIFALLAGSLFAQTTSTITGTIKDLTGAVVTSGKLTFTLRPSTDVTISGLARFTTQTITCLINGSGLVKAQDGVSACVITMNTALQPAGSGYLVSFWPYNVKTATIFMYAISSSIDITTVVSTQAQLPSQGGVVDTFTNQTVGGSKTFSGTVTFNGPTVFSSSSLASPLSLANAGLFTNTQMNLYISSLLNGCNPTTLFQLTHSSVFSTDGFTSCVLVPSSSTVTQINGISAMVQNNANSSTGTVNNAVGGSFVGYAGASGAWVWGINPLVSDAAGLTSTGLLDEYDLNIFGTPGYVSLFRVNGFVTGTMPAGIAPGSSANAGSALMDVVHGVSTNPVWPVGLNFQDGSISNIVLQVGALCTSGSCASPKIAFTSYGGGHVLLVNSINSDAAGNIVISPAAGAPGVKLGAAIYSQSAGVPVRNCAIGDIDTNTSAASASTVLYVCYPLNTWNAVTVP